MNPWQKFILETLAGFETPTTNETKSPDTAGTGCPPPQSELQPRGTHVVDQDFIIETAISYLRRNEAADQNLHLRDVCRDLRAISRIRAISCTVIRRVTKSARASETVAAA